MTKMVATSTNGMSPASPFSQAWAKLPMTPKRKLPTPPFPRGATVPVPSNKNMPLAFSQARPVVGDIQKLTARRPGQKLGDNHFRSARPFIQRATKSPMNAILTLSLTFTRCGQETNDIQECVAAAFHPTTDHTPRANQLRFVRHYPEPAMYAELMDFHRQDIDAMKARCKLILQAKAICRRFCDGDKGEAEKLWKAITKDGEHEHIVAAKAYLTPFLISMEPLVEREAFCEKQMVRILKDLPIYQWVLDTPGLGALSAARILGETGDMMNYSTPAKIWKRMGLAVMNGNRQGRPGQNASADEWIEHGYSPHRRSIMWVIGDCLVKAKGPYREYYLECKAQEIERAEASGLTVAPAAKIPAKDKDAYMSQGHVHNRAKRKMEKRLLRNFWRACRDIRLAEAA